MSLYLDLFDYLALILHGLALLGQTGAIGSVAFLLLIAQPLLTRGIAGAGKVRQGTIRILHMAGGAIAVPGAAAQPQPDADPPFSPLRRGGVRPGDRRAARRLVADLSAARHRSDRGSGDLAGDRRPELADQADLDQPFWDAA